MVAEHIQFAIDFEKRLIELRKRQIQGYEKRIAAMESGNEYEATLKAIPPVKGGVKFDDKKYCELKNMKVK